MGVDIGAGQVRISTSISNVNNEFSAGRIMCMFKKLFFAIAVCGSALIARADVVEIANISNMCGTDHLGRALPEYGQVSEPKKGKQVGLFYYLWHGQHGTEGPYDISKMLEKDPDVFKKPESPLWPDPKHAPMLHWGEPLFGYYQSEDEWVLRRHVQMFIDAGIDILFFDATNGFSFKNVYMRLFRIMDELKSQGFKVPKFCFYLAPATRGSGTGNLNSLWEDLYSNRYYSDMYFMWKGKPLIICHDNRPMPRKIRDFFTFRAPTWQTPDIPNTWYWEGSPEQRVARDEFGNPEEIPVSVSCAGAPSWFKSKYHIGTSDAHFGYPIMSRSYRTDTRKLDDRPNAVDYGIFFQNQIETALKSDAPVAFVTQFNEWLVPFLTKQTNQRYKMVSWIKLQDECDIENSRDIEPMRGGYKDAYWFQTMAFVRRFKGLPAPAYGRKYSSANFDWKEWEKVSPAYVEPVGDIQARCYPGYDACGLYRNTTGRNEFHVLKVGVDKQNIGFYVRTTSDITKPDGRNWMNLFIKVRSNKDKGWEGYQYLINAEPNGDKTSVEYSGEGWNFKKIGEAQIRWQGRNLAIVIPRKLLGVENDADLKLEFKWSDNMRNRDIMDFYENGDAAPRGRLNYYYEFKK